MASAVSQSMVKIGVPLRNNRFKLVNKMPASVCNQQKFDNAKFVNCILSTMALGRDQTSTCLNSVSSTSIWVSYDMSRPFDCLPEDWHHQQTTGCTPVGSTTTPDMTSLCTSSRKLSAFEQGPIIGRSVWQTEWQTQKSQFFLKVVRLRSNLAGW